jgi:hypothetical protein
MQEREIMKVYDFGRIELGHHYANLFIIELNYVNFVE